MTKEYPVIHVWSPTSPHDDSYIVGNREGLEKLYLLIGTALNKGSGRHVSEFYVADGEGYDLHVIVSDDEDNLAVPYTAESAEENRDNVTYPWGQGAFG